MCSVRLFAYIPPFFVNSAISGRFLSISIPLWKQPSHDRQRYKRHHPEPMHALPFVDEAPSDHLPKKPVPTASLWGSTAPHLINQRYRYGEHLRSLPSTFDKLQELYHSEDNLWFHSLDLPLKIPGMLPFVQQLTRTNISEWEPEPMDCPLMEKYLNHSLSELLVLLNDFWVNRVDKNADAVEKRRKYRCRLIASCLESAYQALVTADHESTQSGRLYQLDERATVETFLKRLVSLDIFTEPNVIEGVFGEVNDTIVNPDEHTVRYLIRAELAWQLRCSRPLKQFVTWDHPTCMECAIPLCNFRPEAFDLKPLECYRFSCLPHTQAPDFSEYARSVAGYWSHTPFWRGDPCEFGIVGAVDVARGEQVHSDPTLSSLPTDVKTDLITQHGLSEGLLTAFTWTSAQAYNQGFTLYNDPTYPVTTQLLLFDTEHIQLLRYQLNSLSALWKSEDSGLPYNMAWYSPRIRLYNFDSNAHYPISVNPRAVSLLVAALRYPVDTTHSSSELKPYLLVSENEEDTTHFIPRTEYAQARLSRSPTIDTESADVLLSAQELAALEESEQKAVTPPTRLFNTSRSHPNEMYFLKLVDRSKVNTALSEEMPSFGGEFRELPGRFKLLAQKFWLGKRNRAPRSRVQSPPRRWR